MHRPRSGAVARGAARRGALRLPRAGRARGAHRPRRPAGHPVLPPRDRHAHQHPGRASRARTASPLLGAAEFLALLHRFRNVVLWLNGHTHTNAVRPRRDPADPARGFWEVTTCAIVDWPCQSRLVEIVDAGDCLSIVCTMVDHDTPVAAPVAVNRRRPGRAAPRARGQHAGHRRRLGAVGRGRGPQHRAPDTAAVPAGPRRRRVAGARGVPLGAARCQLAQPRAPRSPAIPPSSLDLPCAAGNI